MLRTQLSCGCELAGSLVLAQCERARDLWASHESTVASEAAEHYSILGERSLQRYMDHLDGREEG